MASVDGAAVNSPVETEVTEVILTAAHKVHLDPNNTAPLGKETGKIDITDMVVAIDINEGIDIRILSGDVLITDAVGALAGLPIVGQERITFKIHKGQIDAAHKQWSRELTFYVRAVENVSRENDFTLSYQLRIVEEAYFLNALTQISQSYTGTISSIMNEVFDEFLKGQPVQGSSGSASPVAPSGFEKITSEEETSGKFKIIIPNWSPYHALKWLTQRARTEANEPFYLYNTLFDGMILKSSRAIFDSVPINDRTLYTQKEHVPETKNDVQRGNAKDIVHTVDMAFFFKMLETTPIPSHILNGVYGSHYKLLDTANKVVDEKIWNYKEEFDALPKLSKFKVNSDDVKYSTDANEFQLGPSVAAEKIYAYSGNSFESSGNMSYNEDTLNNVPFRKAIDGTLGNYAYKIGIPGDKEIQAGKTINLYLNKNEMAQTDEVEKTKDERKSGKHVITLVKHRFHLPKLQYTQMIEVNRETMERDHKDEN